MVAALTTRELAAITAAAFARPRKDARSSVVAAIVATVRAVREHPLTRKILDVDPEFLLPYLLHRRGTSTDAQLDLLAAALSSNDGSIRRGNRTAQARALWLRRLVVRVHRTRPRRREPRPRRARSGAARDARSVSRAMTAPSSALNAARRRRELDELAHRDAPVDVLVIGGGVTGAGVALDAASRGLSVVLVEKHDLAFGTSRWSSKLVHGGLRYLASGAVGIAHESAVERGILMTRTAPHLVRALPQLVPLLPELSHANAALVRAGFAAGDALRVAARTPSARAAPLAHRRLVHGRRARADRAHRRPARRDCSPTTGNWPTTPGWSSASRARPRCTARGCSRAARPSRSPAPAPCCATR